MDKMLTFPSLMEKPEFDILLGKFVKAKRTNKEWSQSQFAARIGNNFQNVSRLERGKLSPTLYWCIEYLAPAFELSASELIKELEDFIIEISSQNVK